MLTADTITDEQILELDRERAIDHDTIEDALSTRIHRMLRADARARCAALFNARAKAEEQRWTEGCARHGEPFCNCERNARAKDGEK